MTSRSILPVLTGELRAPAERGYVPAGLAAEASRRSERTVREWMRLGKVRTVRHAGRVLVHWGDVATLSEKTARRVRLPRDQPRD